MHNSKALHRNKFFLCDRFSFFVQSSKRFLIQQYFYARVPINGPRFILIISLNTYPDFYEIHETIFKSPMQF